MTVILLHLIRVIKAQYPPHSFQIRKNLIFSALFEFFDEHESHYDLMKPLTSPRLGVVSIYNPAKLQSSVLFENTSYIVTCRSSNLLFYFYTRMVQI